MDYREAKKIPITYCKSCGYDFREVIDGTYFICPCCFCEESNDDYTLESLREYRAEWVKHGMQWIGSSPDTFSFEEWKKLNYSQKTLLIKNWDKKSIYNDFTNSLPPPNWNPIHQMLKIDPIFY